MRIASKKLKYWFKKGFYLYFIALLVPMVIGCASTHKTTTIEKTVTYPNKGVIYHGGQQTISDEQQNTEARESDDTTITTTETKTEQSGVLSSTLHAIGYVIALPFIIIGGVFRIIFGG